MDLPPKHFWSGEFAPNMQGRTDLPQYDSACRQVANAVITPAGDAVRRPGWEMIEEVHHSDDATVLIPFVKGSDAYMLEFSDLTMRVYHDGALVESGGNPYELTTPWSGDEVADLVVATRGQAIFHPDHDLYELVCTGDASWTLTAFSSQYGPFLDANKTEALTLTPSATTGTITLLAASALFDSGHVGALFELTHQVDVVTLCGQFDQASIPPFTQNETSSPVTIKGTWDVHLEWRGWGTVKLQRSEDSGSTWKTVKTWDKAVSEHTSEIDWGGEETEDDIQFRFYIDWSSLGDPDTLYDVSLLTWLAWLINPPHCQYTMTAKHTEQTGIVRITAVTSSTVVTATVLNTLGGTGATSDWREGAWSPYRGYPVCGCIHDSRIYAAGSSYKPATIWAGRPFLRREDARVFYAGDDVTDEDAFARTIESPECNEIRWLVSMWVMLAGSDGNLTKCIGASENAPMTPSAFNAIPQSGMGSAALQPVMVAGHVIYPGRSARRVYEMTYSDDARVYSPEDLTRYAEHVTKNSAIAGWCFQQQPYPILWCWLADGTYAGLTRDKTTGQFAWHRHSTDGSVESMAVLPGTDEDELWAVVRRKVGSVYKRYVERMKPYNWGTEQRDCFFVDGGTTWDGGAAASITNITVDGVTGHVTVTATGHGFTDGWTVKFSDVAGMTDLNDKVNTVADGDADTFVLKSRDGTAYISGLTFGTYTSGGSVERVTNRVTGLTQLAGETVTVLLDGQPGTGTVTAAGLYEIGTGRDKYYHNTIHVGRPYTHKLSPTRPEFNVPGAAIGTRKKKVTKCTLRLYNSAGGKIGSDSTDAIPIIYEAAGAVAGADVTLFTGDVEMEHPGGWDKDMDIYFESDEPLPFNVLAVPYSVE